MTGWVVKAQLQPLGALSYLQIGPVRMQCDGWDEVTLESDRCPYEREHWTQPHTRGQRGVEIARSCREPPDGKGGRASPGAFGGGGPADTSIWDCQPPELGDNAPPSSKPESVALGCRSLRRQTHTSQGQTLVTKCLGKQSSQAQSHQPKPHRDAPSHPSLKNDTVYVGEVTGTLS